MRFFAYAIALYGGGRLVLDIALLVRWRMAVMRRPRLVKDAARLARVASE